MMNEMNTENNREELVLIERAPEECNSIMCEINADEIDCNIRGLYDRGEIAFVDGYSEDAYITDAEGNYIGYRIPVFRINKYELNDVEYLALEVDANYQLWIYEHNGFIGNQFGYWHVPMDAVRAVFKEFRRIYG